METVAELHGNHDLLKSNANVKISRNTVKRILRQTPFICWSNILLQRSFSSILETEQFHNFDRFEIEKLKHRLNNLILDKIPNKPYAAEFELS